MILKGAGAVAIWHDLLPEAKDDFYQWHNREHMPERVAIPGFRRGRRYIAVEGAPEFFNLYEADTAEVLAGPDYLERLNNPTAWTRAVVASFRGVARSICAVRFSDGVGIGGYVRTLSFAVDEAACMMIAGRLMPALIPMVGMSAAHFLVADEATSNIETRERKARGDATEVPRHIVLIEGVGPGQVKAAADAFVAALAAEGAAPAIRAATYVLEHVTEEA